MKAITIKQPWATLIALGEKKFETRSWKTKYRGPLAIHAGKSVDKEAFEDLRIKSTLAHHGITSFEQLPTGVVVAITELVECHEVQRHLGYIVTTTKMTNIQGPEVAFGDYTPGRFAWELTNLQVLPEPVPAKGQLSLWKWEHKR